MPKLLNRDPTQEMIDAMSRRYSLVGIFNAAYDAAPEVTQEPFGYVREIRPWEWKFSKTTSWGPDIWAPVFALPPDTQAEIAKRDARIAELEERLNEAVGGFKRDLVKQLQDRRKSKERQAAEISRLKALVGKCEEAILSIRKAEEMDSGLLRLCGYNRCSEALAAIKEEGL